jgi:hypothetical protein
MGTTHATDILAVVDELVAIVAKIGGGVTTSELEYQLRRRGHTVTGADVIDALCHAEAQGLVTPYTWTLGPQAPR